MNSVNLIPEDRRRGGSEDRPSGLYALFGTLGLALVAVTLYVLAGNEVTERQAELETAERKAAAAQRQLAALKPYEDFAALAERRRVTVQSIAASRFDWQRTMRDLAHLTTKDVWLQAVTGTVNPEVSVDGAGTSGSSSFRAGLPNPALEVTGCATSNAELVRFLARLRAMKGVVRVSLADAQKSDSTSGGSGAASAGSTGGCSSSDRWPTFNAVAFFAPLRGALPAAEPGGGTTPASADAGSSSEASSGSGSSSDASSSSSGVAAP